MNFDTAPRTFLAVLRIADRLNRRYLMPDPASSAARFIAMDVAVRKSWPEDGWPMPPHTWPYDHARTVESYLHAVWRGEMRAAMLEAQRAKIAAEDEALRREAWKHNEPVREAAREISAALESDELPAGMTMEQWEPIA